MRGGCKGNLISDVIDTLFDREREREKGFNIRSYFNRFLVGRENKGPNIERERERGKNVSRLNECK